MYQGTPSGVPHQVTIVETALGAGVFKIAADPFWSLGPYGTPEGVP
jgi:hypothetical protein